MKAEQVTSFLARNSSECESIPRGGTFCKELWEVTMDFPRHSLLSAISTSKVFWARNWGFLPNPLQTATGMFPVIPFTVHKYCFVLKILIDVQITFPLAAKGRICI